MHKIPSSDTVNIRSRVYRTTPTGITVTKHRRLLNNLSLIYLTIHVKITTIYVYIHTYTCIVIVKCNFKQQQI